MTNEKKLFLQLLYLLLSLHVHFQLQVRLFITTIVIDNHTMRKSCPLQLVYLVVI
jgi:hypothetical protein